MPGQINDQGTLFSNQKKYNRIDVTEFTMLQFYFLSVVLNALAGYLLFFGDDAVLEFKNGFSLKNESFKFILGILAALIGLLKLLSPIEGDVPVVGDLVPAIAGLLSGFVLIFEYYRRRSSVEDSEQTEKINIILIGNRKIIGMAAFIAAALHFIFPRLLLL